MKKFFLGIAAAMISTVAAMAQTEVQFYLMSLQNDNIDKSTVTAINNKLKSAITRTQAASENANAPFAIETYIDMTSELETDGMVMEVGSLKADLTLAAKNSIDGTVFHTVTIPLSGAAAGGKDASMKAMANSIKVTDPVFVRFIRKARERIADYYAENCATIISQAQILVDAKHYAEAYALLIAISPQLQCYDQARELIAAVLPYLPVDKDNTPTSVAPDTVYVETAPDTVFAKQPKEEPKAPVCRLKISHPEDYSFRIISCVGSRIGEQVKIVAEVINKAGTFESTYFYFKKAFGTNGNEYNRNNLYVRDGRRDAYVNIPKNLPVKIEFTVKDVPIGTHHFAYLEIGISNSCTIEAYSLPITWD